MANKGKPVPWLLTEIGQSQRWLDGITEIENLKLGVIFKISKALEFDFLVDYYKWLDINDVPVRQVLAEPESVYKKEVRKEDITFTLTVRGDVRNASKVMATLKAESEKQGYVID
ncbi:hypothetical protein [Mucilaginibacter gynuensis]|uniref:hypothetical protein n=1 Tax=Mucilaginibacter gynuensis TaxID=1302236 RepID=UPI0031E76083